MAAKPLTEKNGSVMSGYLYYKTKKMSLWHKYWVELYRETSYHPRELQLFQSKSKADNNNSLFESIALNNVLELCDKHRSVSGHPMFQIMSMKMRYQFCTENKQELESWVEVIRQELFGLPQVGVIYEFRVMVIDNPSAKKHSLIGKYTLKVDDNKVMLYSANGLIATSFSVPIVQIWRVKLAPSSCSDSVYSNFVVLDSTDGDVLLLMSASSTDIARIVSHRRQLLSGNVCTETTGEPPYLNVGKRSMSNPPTMPCASGSAVLQKHHLEFESSTENAKIHPTHSISHSSLQNGRSDGCLPPNQNEKPFKDVESTNNRSKYRDGSISRRPPEPIPRPKKLQQESHLSASSILTVPKPLRNHRRRHSAVEDVATKNEYLTVYSDDYKQCSGDQFYSYVHTQKANRVIKDDKDDVYFITNDEMLELRRTFKPIAGRNGSIKGSKSLENLAF